MKKLYICLSLILLFVLYACTPGEESSNKVLPQTLKEAVTLYNQKLSALIDTENQLKTSDSISLRFYNDKPYDPDDMIPREQYLEIYNQQRDNSNHVNLTEYLLQYKKLLDDINILLESYDIDEVEVNLEINFNGDQSLEAYVYLSKDNGIVVKFDSETIFTHKPVFYGIKIGYENEVFFVKKFSHYKETDVYDYFEFLENVSLVQIKYRDENNYRYQYRNQVDNELFEVYHATNNNNAPADYTLMWFNPKTNIRTIYGGGYDPIRHFELFNEKTSIFSYTERLNDKISLRFQLLEASGWDYAYLDSNAHRNEGVYNNGVMLFENVSYRQFNVDLNTELKFANVGIILDMNKDELTNEILSLEAYQMNFNHPEITADYITQTMNNLYEESKHLAVFRGINFYSGNIRETLYNEMDDDLKDIND